MPENRNLKPVKLPMKIRFGEMPTTRFRNNLNAIKIELIEAPSMSDLRRFMVPFLEATWAENPDIGAGMPLHEKDRIIRQAMEGKALPTALETVNLVFKIDGISLQEVTHILRYRTASFSAECSGDKWWTNKDALVPSSIQNSTGWTEPEDGTIGYLAENDFYSRYRLIVEMAKQLYCDMIDSKKISIMDARYILPRCLSTFYFMRMSLKDALHFILQRIDKQIQPETDNIIAYYMYMALLKQYPIMNGLIDIHQPSQFYVKMARTGKATNLYFPDKDSDKFEWHPEDFIYQCTRFDMNGTDPDAENHFERHMMACEDAISVIEAQNAKQLELEYALDRGELDLVEREGDVDDE